MTRLEACIDALKSPHPSGFIDAEDAIAIITRILSAEPTSKEIEDVAAGMAVISAMNWGGDISQYKKGLLPEAKAALLTAFPKQEKL